MRPRDDWPRLPSFAAEDHVYHSWLHLWNRAAGEVLFERLPHFEVIALQPYRLQREAGRVKYQLGLEHEGQGAREVVGLEFGLPGPLEGFRIGPMGLHAAMQAGRAGNEAFGFGIVLTEDQAHELVHRVAVEPGWTKGVLGHHPAWRKDAKINV